MESLFRIRKQNVIEGGNFFFEKEDEINKEFEARIEYWDYLRIGFLSFQAEEQKIKMKIEELINKNKSLYEQFTHIEEEKEEIMNDIQPLEIEIAKLKKENDDLMSEIEKLE